MTGDTAATSDADDPNVTALRRAGYPRVRPWTARSGTPWDAEDAPQSALSVLLPELAVRLVPVAVLWLDDGWHLAYRAPCGLLIGGPPAPAPVLSEEWDALDWRVPDELAALYAVHDGLGLADGPRASWRREAVVPASRLMPLLHRMRFGEENILYRPADLLLFAPDGRGGGLCFERDDPRDRAPAVRAWDAQTRALGPPRPFLAVLRELERRWSAR